jgi:hypothetical protein
MGKLKHIVLVGASFVDEGITEFNPWSTRMIQQFGPDIEPYLDDIMLHARAISTSYVSNQPAQPLKKKRGLLCLNSNIFNQLVRCLQVVQHFSKIIK